MKRILAVWLPNWPVQRLVSTQPELKGQAVILHHAARRGRQVVACSQAARGRGVRAGMPVAEATALVRENLHSEPHDALADRTALKKLAEWCHQYSPCVGVEDLDPPETLLFNVTGIASLFGGEPAFVEQVARGFQRLRLTAQLALADTVGAAWAVSHYGCQNPTVPEAKIVDPGSSNAAIRLLPLAALRLPPTIVETLGRLGLQRIGEMFALPRVELQARLGTHLLERLDQALGEATEVIRSVQPSPDFTAQWLLEHPTDRRNIINLVIERLVEQLTRRLADCGAGALQMICQLDCDPAPMASFEIGLFCPTAKPQHLLELLGMRMEQVTLPGPVNAVLVRVTRHARLEQRQLGLFDQRQRQVDSPQVASLVERLTSRLGRETVFRCVLQSDAQPEIAYRAEPLINRSSREKKSRSTYLSLAPLDRPPHLLEQPLAIQVMAVAPEGRPIQFRYRGDDYYVARHWGPERVETGWWRRRGVQRDYYRVETKTGHRFWLFRQIRSGDWFLHGFF